MAITDKCWSCAPVEKFTDLANNFAVKLADTLADPIAILFASLVALWLVVSGFKLVQEQFFVRAEGAR